MGTIEEINQAIDDKLIETEKDYLTLGQANDLLISHEIMSVAEKYNKSFKKLLEENKLMHAYQTESSPKQWRIPLSENGKLRKTIIPKNNISKKRNITTNTYQSQNINTNYLICPSCGQMLIISKNIINQNQIKCSFCGNKFRNSLIPSNLKSKQLLTNGQMKWIIAIFLAVSFYLFNHNQTEDSTTIPTHSKLFYINKDCYVGTTKQSFDLMFRYAEVGDDQAFSSLEYSGQIIYLKAGTEVYLESAHFAYHVVRLKGSTKNLWIVMENITQK
jgi:DNA-directed RNA polymerase subunit M/transcription elongation factor TFIIS